MDAKVGFTIDFPKLRSLGLKKGARNLSEICSLAGINKNSITPYVKGERSPFASVVLRLSEAFDVSPLDIIIGSDEDEVISFSRKKFKEALDESEVVFLFGSRARGDHKKFSDIDVGITGGSSKTDFSRFVALKSIIEDKFDNYHLSINLVNLDMAPLDFLLQIEADLLYLCGNEKSAAYFQGYLNARKGS
jgi:transcriptional regulator with XRE-family HTH domain